MSKTCERCKGTGFYRRGSFTGFCYTCKGQGKIVRSRRPSVARIEQRLANLQDEKAELSQTLEQDESEYKRLEMEAERFFAPVRETCGTPSNVYVATLFIQNAREVKKRTAARASKMLSLLQALGPLTKSKRGAIAVEVQELNEEIATLESIALSLPTIETTLARKEELWNRLSRPQSIDHKIEALQKELASAQREPEVKMQRLASRVALSDRENRETVLRFRSEVPRTERCPYCSGLIAEFHLDHIVPVSYGGRPCRENLVWVCAACNLKKRDLTLLEFTERFNLDYLAIVRTLRALGKRA